MPLRIRRSLRLGKGVRLIVGKTPSIIMRGGRLTTSASSKGVRRSVRIARGVSYSTKAGGCLLPIVGLLGVLAVLATRPGRLPLPHKPLEVDDRIQRRAHE